MSRFDAGYSDPSEAPTPAAGERFIVWDDLTDPYDHTQLLSNWDRLDAIIGRPSTGAQWPDSEGVGGGIWKEINNIQSDRMPIGAVVPWYTPDIALYPIPTGWVECKGQTILSANHDFPGISSSVVVPDLRNRFVLGAGSTITAGSAGTGTNNAAGAPGIVTPSTGDDGNNSHNDIGSHTVDMANHYHDHDHSHFTNITSVETSTNLVNINRTTPYNLSVPQGSHDHEIKDRYSSSPREAGHGGTKVEDLTVATKVGTSLQKDPTSIVDPDKPTGGSAGDAISMNNRPLCVGLIYIMKVQYSS
jgi:hypothetical protein